MNTNKENKTEEKSYQEINSETIDRWVKEGWEWGKPIDHETFLKAKQGQWDVVLTPARPVPHEWLKDLKGKEILGLASGGGQQMPVFAALGARCTVLDNSEEQLNRERLVSQREGYPFTILKGDMTKPLPFADETFDVIFNLVSFCYIEEILPVWKECYRILKHGGILISGQDKGINYLFADEQETTIVNSLPFNPLENEDQMRQCRETDSGVQFSHTLEEEIGGQLKAGFILTDLYEDTNSEGHLHDLHIPCFLATRAIKP